MPGFHYFFLCSPDYSINRNILNVTVHIFICFLCTRNSFGEPVGFSETLLSAGDRNLLLLQGLDVSSAVREEYGDEERQEKQEGPDNLLESTTCAILSF